jgi:4-hydroxybenzoate polyprenyltransferase
MPTAAEQNPTPGRINALRIVHPFPSFLVAGLTAALAAVAAEDDRWLLAVWLGLAMLSYQFAIGITNDIADADLDRVDKPWKPLPSGAVSRTTASRLAFTFVLGGLVLSFPLPLGAFLVGVLGLACGLGYNVGLKRTPLSWLPYAIAFPLIPMWAFLAAGAWDHLLWWALPLGILLGLSLHLANQLPDILAEQDRVGGAAHHLGPRRTTQLAFAFFGAAASVAVLVVLTQRPTFAFVMAAAGFATALAALRAPRILGRDGLFVAFAAGAALIALLFVAAI